MIGFYDQQPNPDSSRQPSSLETLQPSTGSLLALGDQGNGHGMKNLLNQYRHTLHKLSRYKQTTITENDILPLWDLTAKTASSELHDWIEFHCYYRYPPVIIPDSERLEWVQLHREFDRNKAVQLYRRSKVLTVHKKFNRAERCLKIARFLFNEYVREPGRIVLNATQTKNIEHHIDDQNTLVSNFFDEKIVSAIEMLHEIVDSMCDGKLTIPGIDEGLIRVFAAGVPFEFVMKEHDKLMRYVAKTNGINVRDMHKYIYATVNEMFPTANEEPVEYIPDNSIATDFPDAEK